MSEFHMWMGDDFAVSAFKDEYGFLSRINFHHGESQEIFLSTDWETFNEVIDFIARHGLDFANPCLVEFSETLDSIDVREMEASA